MLMNPELHGIVPAPAEVVTQSAAIPTMRSAPSRMTRRLEMVRLLMTLLPVPFVCGVEATLGIQNMNVLWFLVLTPLAMLWYAADYFFNSALTRLVLREVAHYGLFLTPAVTLFVASLQPVDEAVALAKVMLFWGEMACSLVLVLVLWHERWAAARP